MTGAGALLVLAAVIRPDDASVRWLAWALVAGVVAHLLITAVEFGGKHPTRQASVAAHMITHGRYARTFWSGSVLLTAVAAAVAIPTALGASVWFGVVAGVVVQVGLLAHETVFIKAGQDVPLS